MSTEISPEAFGDRKPESEYVCALIALKRDTTPVANVITDKIRELFPTFEPATDHVDDEAGAGFVFNGSTILINRMAEPIPIDLNDEPTIQRPLTAEGINSHQAYWVITAFDEDLPLAPIAATVTSAAAIECCPDAAAVYWPAANHLIEPNTFVDEALKHVESRPPLKLWINCRVWPIGEDRHAGFTRGLSAFNCKEFEATDSPESAKALRNRLEGLCSYVIRNGSVIRDSHTVGRDCAERIPVLLCRSSYGLHETVLRLDYSEYVPPRPWWKLI